METHTADYMSDYQTRRLGTKFKRVPDPGVVLTYDSNNPPTDFAHTNDATAFALGRTMVAIIENYQRADGKIMVPEVVRPYMNGQTEL
jgi:seryl-tRNA synthetase